MAEHDDNVRRGSERDERWRVMSEMEDARTDRYRDALGVTDPDRRHREGGGGVGAHRGRGPKGYRRSDARIQEDVCDRLTEDPGLDASGIEVTVAEGEVTLSGTVDGRAARHRAEDLAAAVSGVRQVLNHLRAG
jgi:hypothetical protein